jgi:hypothetical protein
MVPSLADDYFGILTGLVMEEPTSITLNTAMRRQLSTTLADVVKRSRASEQRYFFLCLAFD